MNKTLRSILKTAVCVMDQYNDRMERASERVSDLVDRGQKVIYHREDHLLRNALSFAAGVSVGIGAGILFAPASGKEIRGSIIEKAQEIRHKAS